MALADYQPERREIVLKGGSFFVMGLSLDKVAVLIRTHLSDVEALFQLVEGVLQGRTDFTESDMERVAMAMAEEAPGFTANLIAIAAGENTPKAVENARLITFPKQVEILKDIGTLTFEEVGGIKKAWGIIGGLLANPKLLAQAKT